MQKRPVLLEQLAVPQVQLKAFAELPSITLQLERLVLVLQVFLDKLQMRPEVPEQLAVPHVHGSELAELPSITLQLD